MECPFGAIDEDERRFPVFNEERCRRCGTCMGACPVRVISFENYSIDTVGSQLKAVDVPDEFSEKPRILILACENDAYPALDMAAMNRNELASVRMSKIGDTLKNMALEEERVSTFEVAITDIERVPQLINDYAALIQKIGMSPMKGF